MQLTERKPPLKSPVATEAVCQGPKEHITALIPDVEEVLAHKVQVVQQVLEVVQEADMPAALESVALLILAQRLAAVAAAAGTAVAAAPMAQNVLALAVEVLAT